jgi:hypothetical protein
MKRRERERDKLMQEIANIPRLRHRFRSERALTHAERP